MEKTKLSLCAPFSPEGERGLYLWREVFLAHFDVLAYPKELCPKEGVDVEVQEGYVKVYLHKATFTFWRARYLHVEDAPLSLCQRSLEKEGEGIIYDTKEGHLAFIEGEFWLAEVKAKDDEKAFATFVAQFLHHYLSGLSLAEVLEKAGEASRNVV